MSERNQNIILTYSENGSFSKTAKRFGVSRQRIHQIVRGYVRVHVPNHHRADKCGRVCEHIIKAEEKLGRPLMKGEVLHHINGNGSDNRLENLEVYVSQSEHIRLGHHKRLGEHPIRIIINTKRGIISMSNLPLDDHITINVDPALKQTIQIFAKQKYLSVSDIVRISIMEYLTMAFPEFQAVYAQQQELLEKGI